MSKTAQKQAKRLANSQLSLQRDATRTLTQLVTQFYEVFMANDPHAEEVAVKRKQVSAKWKMYCMRMKLKDESLTLCDENCQSIVNKYNEQLKGMEEVVNKFDLSGEVSDKPIDVLK